MSQLDDDIFDEPRPKASSRRERRSHQPRRRGGRALLVMVLAGVVLLAGALLSFSNLRSLIPGGGEQEAADFAGPGSGQVEVTVQSGQSGSQIGDHLQERGVVKTSRAFVKAAAAEPDKAAKIQPGVYQLKKEMRAGDAFAWLADPANRVAKGVTLSEGLWRSEIYAKLAKGTGTPKADYEKAERSPKLKLPAEAQGSVEGWLFPATYEFEKGTSAVDQLNTMIAKTVDELEQAGVAKKDWERTLTVASIVEGESGAADRGKVARVIENRLADPTGPTVGMLQMDSTIHYLLQKRGTITTSDKERKQDSPYNTYQNKGLPPGPINNPGAEAINAAAHPDEGDWLFFVTVDPETGETKFAKTQKEHDKNVQEFCQRSGACQGPG